MKWGSSRFDDRFVLEVSGRSFYANNHIVGISPHGGVSYGADGSVEAEEFTPEERAELADFMIALWMQFKESA